MKEHDGTGDIRFALTGDVVVLTWQGFISKGNVGTKPDELEAFLADKQPRFAIFDATPVTGFSADSREPGGAILACLKRRGVVRTCVVTESGSIRMIGSAVALATGHSVRFFENRVMALAEISKLRAQKPAKPSPA